MNITFLNYSMQNGGAERVISGLANDFAQQGDNVSIIVLDDKLSGYPLDERIDFINLNIGKTTKNVFQTVLNFIKELCCFRKYILKSKSDVVISFQCKYAVIAKLACGKRVKVIGSERSNPFVTRKGKLNNFIIRLSSVLDGFVFQTNGAKKYYPDKTQQKSEIIPNPINLKMPEYIPDLLDRPKQIVATGRIVKSKRYDLMIQAFSQFSEIMPDYILNIFGEGNEKDNITQLIEHYGMTEKIFLKGVSNDISSELLTSRFFVLASDYEGMPNGLMEAMACGCACVSTDCDFGPSELIENGKNGVLVNKGDADEIAIVLGNLSRNIDSAVLLSENAKEISKSHSLNKICNMWYCYINKILDNRI